MDEAAMLPPPPPPPLSLQKALQQCELVQNMIDISISNLEGLRTKCATSNDLTQKEIRTLEAIEWKTLVEFPAFSEAILASFKEI
ncbi:kinase suppressor of Ras 2-like [Pantherophis guttatus]|uniref:Kinase suppressor of Ras 2-like n=1 Tax=Pantherophis guttatus TaxID=94885 RepID=A0ABM3YUI9_PANGU|nr:kinase suppressor of Ras 2-like [Pantherophis guttatus]